ncbi:hypothetical protein [Spirosoma flavum]|uniref:Uncharacterized protein n=1 Tax=Spirosoma flavum TaxID=2048557 RepID=A0ABW6APE9_9BACT
MKKQFAIKPVQVLKSIAQQAAKKESINFFNFLLEDGKSPCCYDWDLTRMVATR